MDPSKFEMAEWVIAIAAATQTLLFILHAYHFGKIGKAAEQAQRPWLVLRPEIQRNDQGEIVNYVLVGTVSGSTPAFMKSWEGKWFTETPSNVGAVLKSLESETTAGSISPGQPIDRTLENPPVQQGSIFLIATATYRDVFKRSHEFSGIWLLEKGEFQFVDAPEFYRNT